MNVIARCELLMRRVRALMSLQEYGKGNLTRCKDFGQYNTWYRGWSLNMEKKHEPTFSAQWPQIKHYAKTLGFRYLGTGHFSVAFAISGTDQVLKVGFKRSYDGAFHWARYCRDYHGTLSMLPAVYWMDSDSSETWCALLQYYYSYEDNETHEQETMRRNLSHYMRGARTVVDNWMSDDERATCHLIHEFGKEHNFRVDLHSSNVMWEYDDDGCLCPIITDPFSYTSKDTDMWYYYPAYEPEYTT